jgi:hypothetical protein
MKFVDHMMVREQQFPLMAYKSSVTSGSGEISQRFDHLSSSLGETFTIRNDRRFC